MTVKKAFLKSINNVSKRNGYELVPFWKMQELPLVRHLKKFFDHYKIDTVIDVGANRGQYRDLLRDEVGFSGRIISFEPVSKHFNFLQEKSTRDPLWKIYNCALGSETGEAEINLTAFESCESFLAPRTDVVQSFWKGDAVIGAEKVQVRTLDSVIEELGIKTAECSLYLKLDTQGFDLEVIRGGDNILEGVIGLQTEASVRPIYHGMPSYLDMISILNEKGFDLTSMCPITDDRDLRLVELDFVFVNNRFTKQTAAASASLSA